MQFLCPEIRKHKLETSHTNIYLIPKQHNKSVTHFARWFWLETAHQPKAHWFPRHGFPAMRRMALFKPVILWVDTSGLDSKFTFTGQIAPTIWCFVITITGFSGNQCEKFPETQLTRYMLPYVLVHFVFSPLDIKCYASGDFKLFSLSLFREYFSNFSTLDNVCISMQNWPTVILFDAIDSVAV